MQEEKVRSVWWLIQVCCCSFVFIFLFCFWPSDLLFHLCFVPKPWYFALVHTSSSEITRAQAALDLTGTFLREGKVWKELSPNSHPVQNKEPGSSGFPFLQRAKTSNLTNNSFYSFVITNRQMNCLIIKLSPPLTETNSTYRIWGTWDNCLFWSPFMKLPAESSHQNWLYRTSGNFKM